jgi:hypothetical protein
LLLEPRLRRRFLFRGGAPLQVLDLLRQIRQQIRKHATLEDVAGQALSRVLVSDDVGDRREDLIAVRVVVVEVRVDQEPDRLVGDRLQIAQQRSAGFRRHV